MTLQSHILCPTKPLPCLLPKLYFSVCDTLQALCTGWIFPVKFAMVVLALPIPLTLLLVSVVDGVTDLRIKIFSFWSLLKHAIFTVTRKICAQNRSLTGLNSTGKYLAILCLTARYQGVHPWKEKYVACGKLDKITLVTSSRDPEWVDDT